MSRKVTLLWIVVFVSSWIFAAEEGGRQRIEADLRFLADDLLEGRGTPGRGLDISALYLANQLRAAGWKPAVEGSYLQTFEVVHFSPQSGSYDVTLNGVPLAPEEYYLAPFSLDPAKGPFLFDLVFAGHGLYAPEKKVDNFRTDDLQGKGVVALFGAPWGANPVAPHAYDRSIGKSVHVTVRNGGALVYVTEEMESRPADSPDISFLREMATVPYSTIPEANGRPTMGLGPILAISPAVFDRTLAAVTGHSYAEWQEGLAKGGFEARPIEACLEIALNVERQSAPASNVLAVLEGTDPELKKEWVVLSAHYDHLGYKEVGAGEDGVWNGADDNGSGTASLLEVARRLGAGPAPRRSVLIFFTAGEDRGLIGSAYYAKHPVVPMDDVVVNINVDMVGRSSGTVVGYTEGAEPLFQVAAESAREAGLEMVRDDHPEWRIIYFIDSYHLARFGIPFIEFFTSFHEDYHQPSDEVEKINFDGLAKITDAVIHLTRRYAGGDAPPTFERPAWFLTPPTD